MLRVRLDFRRHLALGSSREVGVPVRPGLGFANMQKPESVEGYLAGLGDEARAALQKLRETIAAVVPEAEEGIVYGMPGFKLHGKGLVGYSAFKDHYSFFPMGGSPIEPHREELGEHVTGKGTISFTYGERLPVGVVRKVVKTRLAEVRAKSR